MAPSDQILPRQFVHSHSHSAFTQPAYDITGIIKERMNTSYTLNPRQR